MLALLTAPLRYLAHAASSPSVKPTVTPATLTTYCTDTPDEAKQRGLALRDPAEHGWDAAAK